MKQFICLIALSILASIAYGRMINCHPTINGHTYDFTPLMAKSGSYLWSSPYNGSDYWWQLQMCGDVMNPISSCTHPAPVYQITDDKSSCTYLGDTPVYAWDPTPYNDGVMLTYFHGQYLNNIATRSVIIYLLCNQTGDATPFFEHVRSCTDPTDNMELGGQYHFAIQTKYACAN